MGAPLLLLLECVPLLRLVLECAAAAAAAPGMCCCGCRWWWWWWWWCCRGLGQGHQRAWQRRIWLLASEHSAPPLPPPSCFSPACTSARPHCLYCHLYRRLTRRTYIKEQDPKRVYYMSMEFLMGRSLLNALNNLGIKDQYTEAITELGYKLEILVGGLGGLWQGLLAGRGWVGGWVGDGWVSGI